MNPVLTESGFQHWTGRLVRTLRRRHYDHCITILGWHSISRARSPFTEGLGLRHSPDSFEAEVSYLAENYNVFSLSAVIDALERGEELRRAVVLTFDDGYGDAIRQALPVLYRRRLPMTIFPVTSVIGNTDLLWQHKLDWLVANGHEQRIWDVLLAEGWDVAGRQSRVGDFLRRNYLPELPGVLEEALRSVGQSSAELARKHRLYLEPEEIAAADPEFVEFGNHTDTHPVLSCLTITQQMAELAAAQRKLLEITGRPPIAVAYPFGLKWHYTPDTVRLVRDTGHKAALDMRRRLNIGSVDPFDLSRKPVACKNMTEFEMMMEDWPANARVPGSRGVMA